MDDPIIAPGESTVNGLGGIRLAGWSFRAGEITPSELLVLTAIAAFSDKKGECWPSVSTISRLAKTKERAVRYTIKRLCEKKMLEVEERNEPSKKTKETKQTSNLYRILVRRQIPGVKNYLPVIKAYLGINAKKSEILVLLALYDFRVIDNNVQPSQRELARRTGLTRETVNLAVLSLFNTGEYVIENGGKMKLQVRARRKEDGAIDTHKYEPQFFY